MSFTDIFLGIQVGIGILIGLVSLVLLIVFGIRRINSKGNEDFIERDN